MELKNLLTPHKDKVKTIENVLLIFLAVCFGGLIIYGVFSVTREQPPQYTSYPMKQLIVDSSQEMYGGMFLFIGSVSSEEELHYIFYTRNQDGGYRLWKIAHYNVEIYEDATLETAWAETMKLSEYFSKWKLHVPPNSISSEVDLNLQSIN